MTVYQSQSNGYAAYKVQSALGTQATGAGGTIIRQTGGAGINLTKAAIESNEVRKDGMSSRGRHGTQKTTSAWTAQASLDSHNAIIEAVMRDTWDASDLVLTQTDFTSITTGANTIVFTSGNPITLGLRIGDVIRLTNYSASADNGTNKRITGLSATTITTAETNTVNAVADTTVTITRPKKLIQYSAGSLVKRYFTIDEYNADIDQSTVLTDFVFGSIKFSMAANGLLMADPGGVGTGQIAALASGASPLLTSPTLGSTAPFSVVDATIRVKGVDVVDLTSFDLTIDTSPASPDVFGSGGIKYAPDVFTGQMAVSMNLTALRKNLAYLQDFISETVYELHVLAVENESEPKDFLSIYVGNFTLGGVTPSPLSRAGGAMTETISIPAALVGADSGTGRDGTMVKFQSSGA
jgi:hypothetical protein